MQIKKLVLAGTAAALLGGFAFAPTAQADDQLPENGVVQVDGAQNEAGDGGYVVVRGEGDVPVNPLDNGYIGVYGDVGSGPGLKGSCSGEFETDEDGNELEGPDRYSNFDPAGGDEADTAACQPGPA